MELLWIIPPKAATLIFQSLDIKLNLIIFNILFFLYLGLSNKGENITKWQFCLCFVKYSNWLCTAPIILNSFFRDSGRKFFLLLDVIRIPSAPYLVAKE